MLERTIGKVMGKHSILVGIFVIIVAIVFIINSIVGKCNLG